VTDQIEKGENATGKDSGVEKIRQPFGLEKERAGGDQFGISAAEQSGHAEHDEDSESSGGGCGIGQCRRAAINQGKVGETKKGKCERAGVRYNPGGDICDSYRKSIGSHDISRCAN
jgi:hypothetical protein